MFITVRTMSQTEFEVPLYLKMPACMYLTHVLAPHMGLPVADNGDVYTSIIFCGGRIFKADDKDKLMEDVLQPQDRIYTMMPEEYPRASDLVGNGSTAKPTKEHYKWAW